jgi:rhodanese-related sulfurtransferase
MPGKRSGVKRMSMTKEAVMEKMKEKNVVVLNVLPDADYAKLHIKGSENLPLGLKAEDFVQAAERRFGKTRFLITYCAGFTCNAGPDAAKALKARGFEAEDYPGGIKEWSDAGFPTEGTEAKQAEPAAK